MSSHPLQTEQAKSPGTMLPNTIPSCSSLPGNKNDSRSRLSPPRGELARSLQDSIKHRILYLLEQLRVEKAVRDENTVGYLKLVSRADRHQAPHIRQAFERVNQRASATIAQIERRLRICYQQLQALEQGSRPQDLVLKSDSDLHRCEPPTMASGNDNVDPSIRCYPSESPCPGTSLEPVLASQHGGSMLCIVTRELREVRDCHLTLQASYQSLRDEHLADLQEALQTLQEKKYRQTSLEEQVDEHLQRHLDEISLLKQNLACTEEKMVYLSYERAKEIWEVMEMFQSRIARLESSQQGSQLQIPRKVRTGPCAQLLRCVGLLLMFTIILLLFVSAACAWPLLLLGPCLHICTAFLLVLLGALACHRWHTFFMASWWAWFPSGRRLHSKDTKPLPKGL